MDQERLQQAKSAQLTPGCGNLRVPWTTTVQQILQREILQPPESQRVAATIVWEAQLLCASAPNLLNSASARVTRLPVAGDWTSVDV